MRDLLQAGRTRGRRKVSCMRIETSPPPAFRNPVPVAAPCDRAHRANSANQLERQGYDALDEVRGEGAGIGSRRAPGGARFAAPNKPRACGRHAGPVSSRLRFGRVWPIFGQAGQALAEPHASCFCRRRQSPLRRGARRRPARARGRRKSRSGRHRQRAARAEATDRPSSRAQGDLGEIWACFAEQWNRDQAERYIDAPVRHFGRLRDNPSPGKPRPQIGGNP